MFGTSEKEETLPPWVSQSPLQYPSHIDRTLNLPISPD